MAQPFFDTWTIKIFGRSKKSAAKKLLMRQIESMYKSSKTNQEDMLKKLLMKGDVVLMFKCLYDKVKFGLFRKLNIYESYKTIK